MIRAPLVVLLLLYSLATASSARADHGRFDYSRGAFSLGAAVLVPKTGGPGGGGFFEIRSLFARGNTAGSVADVSLAIGYVGPQGLLVDVSMGAGAGARLGVIRVFGLVGLGTDLIGGSGATDAFQRPANFYGFLGGRLSLQVAEWLGIDAEGRYSAAFGASPARKVALIVTWGDRRRQSVALREARFADTATMYSLTWGVAF